MLAGIAMSHCQSNDLIKNQITTSRRSLCIQNGIDSTTIFFCKQERLLASIKDHYCQVLLYNDLGFQIMPQTKDGFIDLNQLGFFFENYRQINSQYPDSSKSIELEKENWEIGSSFSSRDSFVIVCYWSARKYLQEQLYRMQQLQKLKTHFSHISIRLIFINQDFIP